MWLACVVMMCRIGISASSETLINVAGGFYIELKMSEYVDHSISE